MAAIHESFKGYQPYEFTTLKVRKPETTRKSLKRQFCLDYKAKPWQYHIPRPLLSRRAMPLAAPLIIDHDNPYLFDIVEDKIAQEQVTSNFLVV